MEWMRRLLKVKVKDKRTEEEKVLYAALHDVSSYCNDRFPSITPDERIEFRRLVTRYDMLQEKYELSQKTKKELLEEDKASNLEKKRRICQKKNN